VDVNEDEVERLREKIAHDQTRCRCGHLLAACADCRDWLIANSPRIATALEWWYIKAVELRQDVSVTWGADTAEADDLAWFMAGR
jgi:hypothetical protein